MTTSNLFKKLEKLHWVWFWSGNWPRLDCITERDRGFIEEFQKMAGIHPQISADVYQNGLLTAYHCQEEYDRMETSLTQRFNRNSTFILRSLSDYERRTTQDISAIAQTVAGDLRHRTNKELAQLFERVRMHWKYNSAVDHWAWYIEKFFTPFLEAYLTKRLSELGKDAETLEYLAALVSPRRPSRIYKERVAFFRLASHVSRIRGFKKAAQATRNIRNLQMQFPPVAVLVRRHVERYGWLCVLVNNPPVREQDIWKELIAAVKGTISLTLEVKRLGDNFDKSILEKKRRYLKELAPDLNTAILIRALERTAFVRTEDNAVMSRSAFLTIPLYTEIAEHLGISYYNLKELNPDEVVSALVKNWSKKKVQTLVRVRHALSGYVVYAGKPVSLDSGAASRLKQLVESSVRKPQEGVEDVFKGTPASRGVARGRAIVVMSSHEAATIKKGDILIAPATSADFVPAMRKAGAIVTQMGGLTSHAAVVAREFGVPCIVGVPNIVSCLKTGDMVEVDANRGVVRKI